MLWGDYCKFKDGGISLMSFDLKDQRWQASRCERCTDENDIINPPDPYIRPSLMVSFQIQSIQRFRYKLIQTLR